MGSASTRVLITTTPISGNMKHNCTSSFFRPLLLLGLLPLLISVSASSYRVDSNDIVSSNIEAKVEGDMHQIVQREAVPRRRKQQRKGKGKEQKGRSKKCKNGKNSCKKKSKSKKQEGGR